MKHKVLEESGVSQACNAKGASDFTGESGRSVLHFHHPDVQVSHELHQGSHVDNQREIIIERGCRDGDVASACAQSPATDSFSICSRFALNSVPGFQVG